MEYILFVTKDGTVKKVSAESFRPMGRHARGMVGITLEDGNEVVSAVITKK